MEDRQVEALRNQLGRLVFRRVGQVQVAKILENRLYSSPGTFRRVDPDGLATVAPEEWLQSGEQHAARFYGFTSPCALRANDPVPGERLFFHQKHRAELNPVTFTFAPAGLTVQSVVPRARDLLCGEVRRPGTAEKSPVCVRWFICSEQFYRMWTLVMYDKHDSFRKAEKKECGSRVYWMSGNRLMTNSYKKWLWKCREAGETPGRDEKVARYWRPRTEAVATAHVHVYCAVVLLARFREQPSDENVPANRGDDSPSAWDLPVQYVPQLLAAFPV